MFALKLVFGEMQKAGEIGGCKYLPGEPRRLIRLKLLVWEGYLLFHMPDVQEALRIFTNLFVVSVQGICLILHCFVIVDRCLLLLIVEEYLSELSFIFCLTQNMKATFIFILARLCYPKTQDKA